MQGENKTKWAIQPEILTLNGTYLDYENPEKHPFHTVEIGMALSRLCRFVGHIRTDFPVYSVAQHSVYVAQLVSEENRLAALLHDASEAYIGDMAAPLKQMFPDFKKLEKRIQAAIYKHFKLPEEMPDEVKEADLIMLATEKRQVAVVHHGEWTITKGIKPANIKIEPWSQHEAYIRYTNMFFGLLR